MKKNKSYLIMRKALILSAIFFLIGQYSCKKDGKLSPDFDDGGLTLAFVDTLSITSSLAINDSLRTDFSILNPLGIYHDPIFGPVSSSIYTQVLLTGVNVDFSNAIIDSIVLTLDYEKLYGDTASPMVLNVYELTENLSWDNEYFNNTYTSHSSTILASKSFLPNLFDSVNILHDKSTLAPHLRIKLPNSLGQTIINNSPYSDNTDFFNTLKGLYITTQDSVDNTSLSPGTGSIISFDLNSTLSTVSLFYHFNNLSQSNQLQSNFLKYDFTINSSSVKYSRFDHNYTGTDIEAHLNNLPSKDTTVSYVSALAGVKTKIEFPYIKNLIKNGPILINKAELIVTVVNGTEGNFDDPLESISLAGIDENGDSYFLPDFFEGQDYFGGTYNEDNKTYAFNIGRHINDLIYSNSGNFGLYIVANGATTTASRSVIGSEKNATAKIKLNITYSKL